MHRLLSFKNKFPKNKFPNYFEFTMNLTASFGFSYKRTEPHGSTVFSFSCFARHRHYSKEKKTKEHQDSKTNQLNLTSPNLHFFNNEGNLKHVYSYAHDLHKVSVLQFSTLCVLTSVSFPLSPQQRPALQLVHQPFSPPGDLVPLLKFVPRSSWIDNK